jgi:thymidine phosphorylase
MELKAVRMGIDTHQEYVVYLRADSAVSRAEGLDASARVMITDGQRQVIATLNVVDPGILSPDHIGLSNVLWNDLDPVDTVSVTHAPVVESMSAVRGKIYNRDFTAGDIEAVIADIARGYFSDLQIAAFLTASAGGRLNRDEVSYLTRAMVSVGDTLDWPGIDCIYDKHCVGGLPGNRTTPIVVAIASAAGLVMPKTSSRAITSPAGTADTMETLTEVELDIDRIRLAVEDVGACLAWGGGIKLSPVDDVLIRVERSLDLDSKGQMVASVLSKKMAAGANHVLIDIPVGPTAKVRDLDTARGLHELFNYVADALGLRVSVVLTDGSQPIGRGIGPALEARDVLAVLRGDEDAPADLRDKALELGAHMLALADAGDYDQAWCRAEEILSSGRAWRQFQRIREAQGGQREPGEAPWVHELDAHQSGRVDAIDNRRIARLAKLAGAPRAPTAGLELLVRTGDEVTVGDPLLRIHAESQGERDYALVYYLNNRDMIHLGRSM